jgi:DNA-binding transcriptional regulator YiaG
MRKMDNSSPRHRPTGDEIKRRRLKANLSRKEAAELIGVSYRTFQDFELDVTAMRPAFWELLKIKTKRGD